MSVNFSLLNKINKNMSWQERQDVLSQAGVNTNLAWLVEAPKVSTNKSGGTHIRFVLSVFDPEFPLENGYNTKKFVMHANFQKGKAPEKAAFYGSLQKGDRVSVEWYENSGYYNVYQLWDRRVKTEDVVEVESAESLIDFESIAVNTEVNPFQDFDF